MYVSNVSNIDAAFKNTYNVNNKETNVITLIKSSYLPVKIHVEIFSTEG